MNDDATTRLNRLAGELMRSAHVGIDPRGFRIAAKDVEPIAEAIAAVIASAPAGDGVEGRFWLIVREPGMVPDRKGPFRHTDTAKILREFMAANPRAFIDHLTVDTDGTPWVDHGPEVLQMTDGRSMSVGRKHNARVREVAEEALARPRAAVGEREYAEAIRIALLQEDGDAWMDDTDTVDAFRIDGTVNLVDVARILALQSPPAKVEG